MFCVHTLAFSTWRDLGCLQLDLINAVVRSHQRVVWGRVGNYELAAFPGASEIQYTRLVPPGWRRDLLG
jgi:uncharacterized protein YcaQ